MSFGTWNVRSLYRRGSLMAVARELAKYKLDLVGVQEVRWDKEGTVRAGEYTFNLWQRAGKSSNGNRINCTPQNSISNQKSGDC
jgi:exonuclease III